MKILVLQHIESEHPGIFRDFWNEAGHSWTPVELDQGEPLPPLEPFDLMVSMGGPMDVWEEDLHPWMIAEKQAIRRWVGEMRRPYLGVCLGHQMLADALGGEVRLRSAAEVGIVHVELTPAGRSDSLLAGLPPALETLQWHGAEVSRLPDGAESLAANAACDIQALRWGECAYGLQFHVEITDSTVADWQEIPAYLASLKAALGEEGAAGLGPAVNARLADFNRTARVLNENLMTIVAARSA